MKKLLLSKINPQSLKLIQDIATFQQKWQLTVDIEKDFYLGLKTTTIITSAGASTRIEGATLSDEAITKKLVGLKIQHIGDRDDAEVAGYIDCKKYIFDAHQELSISEHTIRSLHQMMMSYLPEDLFPLAQRGIYKNITNAVVRIDHETKAQEVIFETTPPGPQTEAAMQELIADYNDYSRSTQYADLEIIAAFIVKFLAIHPFRDGNGRLSRLLTDLCLIKQGYQFCMYSSHEKIIEANKMQYYVALRQTQTQLDANPDLNPWLYYFLKILSGQTNALAQYLNTQKIGTLTDKEEVIYELIQKHPEVSIGFLQRETGFKNVTIKAILSRLKKRGFIDMTGERKSSRYHVKNK